MTLYYIILYIFQIIETVSSGRHISQNSQAVSSVTFTLDKIFAMHLNLRVSFASYTPQSLCLFHDVMSLQHEF